MSRGGGEKANIAWTDFISKLHVRVVDLSERSDEYQDPGKWAVMVDRYGSNRTETALSIRYAASWFLKGRR